MKITPSQIKIFKTVAALALLVLFGLSIYTIHLTRKYSLPASITTEALTNISSILSLIYILLPQRFSKNVNLLLNFILTSLPLFLAGNYASDFPIASDASTCSLETTWLSFFRSKNAKVIQFIQDDLACCGLRNSHHLAWPFPGQGRGSNACELMYHRNQGCLESWRYLYGLTVGIGLAISLSTILINILHFVLVIQPLAERGIEENRVTERDEPYSDDPMFTRRALEFGRDNTEQIQSSDGPSDSLPEPNAWSR